MGAAAVVATVPLLSLVGAVVTAVASPARCPEHAGWPRPAVLALVHSHRSPPSHPYRFLSPWEHGL